MGDSLKINNLRNNNVVDITGINDWMKKFNLYNRGDEKARNVNVILCLKDGSKINVAQGWQKKDINLEEPYKIAYQNSNKLGDIGSHNFAPLNCFSAFNSKASLNEECMLILSYSNEKPKRIFFSFIINVNKVDHE